MKNKILFYFLLFLGTKMFSISQEAQTNINSITNMSSGMSEELGTDVSSVLLFKGAQPYLLPIVSQDFQGIPVSIDWDRIPDFGLPKSEITEIQIVKMSNTSYISNVLMFSPSLWIFKAPTWSYSYYGRIPYLENLEFLEAYLSEELFFNTISIRKQNSLGYFQDQINLDLGIFRYFSPIFFHNIDRIEIISAEKNKKYRIMQKQEEQKEISIMELETPIETNNSNSSDSDLLLSQE